MIVATLATIPSRKNIVAATIESLRHQVDLVMVALNYPKNQRARLPKHPNVRYVKTDAKWGDANKFYPIYDIVDSYILSCDDDIAYPDTYAQDMVEAVNTFGTLVTLHGMVIHEFPLKRFYGDTDRTITLQCLHGFDKNYYVHVVGSGVSCWHTNMLRLSKADFLSANMADVWLSIACRKAKLRPIAVRHPKDYLHYLNPPWTIYEQRYGNDTVETQLVNTHLMGWF